MRAKRSWVALAVGLVVLAIPAPASAAVTIGEDTSTTGTGDSGCSNLAGDTCTWFQPAHPTRSYSAPFDGVIVRWRILGDSDQLQYSLRVLRKNDGTFTGAGTGEPRTVIPVVVNVFDTRLPIKQGELIGVDIPGDPSIPTIETSTVPGSQQAAGFQPRLADDETRVTDFAFNNRVLLYNADIEPDCDSDGFGDETQDASHPCPRSLSLDANKNKVKKGKRVTLTGQLTADPQDEACVEFQTVELQRRKPNAAEFTTVDQLPTDGAGVFSSKRPVKKTFEYRAQVAETATCGGQISNPEKVKVKKPK